MWRFFMLSVLCGLIGMSPSEGGRLYVSPKGNDSWTGTLAQANRNGDDGPFATIERAREAIRQARKMSGRREPATVVLREGTYRLQETLALGPEDSATTYEAAKGDRVTISGGRLITGFGPTEVNGRKVLVADVPGVKDGKWSFTQLFVNGVRRPRTRLPKEGWYYIADLAGVPFDVEWTKGQDRFRFKEGEIKNWKNLSDVDIVGLTLWVEMRMPIKSVDEASHTVELAKKSTFRLTEDQNQRGGRYFIENVFEALDTPGQWYLDRPAGKLYYYPMPGEDAEKIRVEAPSLEQIVRVVGEDGKPVEEVAFRNISFAHSEFRMPAQYSGSAQAAVDVPGAVYFENARNCSVSQCDVSHIGTYAVEFGKGCRGNKVEKSRMVDLGAGGVKISAGSEGTTVVDNEIGDGGKVFMSAVGVWIGDSPSNKVLHNNIHDLYYTGVSLGWTWGYAETRTRENIIEQNHIHNIGSAVLSDMGGIYSLGTQPGSVLRNNLIHDIQSYGYGGWGIYTDEGSSGILIENNVVYKTKTGGFHQHYGKENIVRNNIFALASEQQLQRSREEEHLSFTFERNIVYYEQGALLGSNWANDHYEMDHNVYWDASGRPVEFAGVSFDEWKKRGHDEHSVIADPLFVDAKKRDFRLKPDSPALKMGFKQIDASKAGPRGRTGPQ